MRVARLLPLVAVFAVGCRPSASTEGDAPHASAVQSFAAIPVQRLQRDAAAHVGDVFLERFLFFRVWWSPDRARPHERTTDLPTHFEARIVAAPLYVARIEFPPAQDERFAAMREGTELCLRVRFLRTQPVSGSPVFALEGEEPRCPSPSAG